MEIRGPARGHPLLRTSADPQGEKSLGTWANCGNGKTPWGTYLACEENFHVAFGNSSKGRKPNSLQKRYRIGVYKNCLLYTSPSPRDGLLSRMPSSA